MAGFHKTRCLSLIGLLIIIAINVCVTMNGENVSGESVKADEAENSCFCELHGQVDDCTCTIDSIDSLNTFKLQPLLNSLLRKTFFRYYKVNLYKQCLFWHDDMKCMSKDCTVNVCKDEEIPIGLKGTDLQHDDHHENDCSSKELSALNETISEENIKQFASWKMYDDAIDNFCDIDDETSKETQYVDLLLNPEKFTGYRGQTAQRIWKSIYDENCFDIAQGTGYINAKDLGGQCLEKRAFYRAISGLHTSITVHLCANFFYPGKDFGKGRFDYNVDAFQKRFSKETTGGEGPIRLRNLYFLYLLELRAIAKAAPYLEEYQFYTGEEKEDVETKAGVLKLLDFVKDFPNHFDESLMFQGKKKKAMKLREEFRQHFYNISKIMDCVGCDKCRLWGKLQVQGLGTALKILFSHSSSHVGAMSTVDSKSKHDFQLSRQEITALLNAFGRLSNSIKELDNFKKLLPT